MSKSYNNTIPMFIEPKKLRKLVMKIVTNSQTIEEPKDPETCNIFTLYKLFANKEQQNEMRKKYISGGMGWGSAKQTLFELMDETLAPLREKYHELMNNKEYIDNVLNEGSKKACEIAFRKIKFLKKEIGME